MELNKGMTYSEVDDLLLAAVGRAWVVGDSLCVEVEDEVTLCNVRPSGDVLKEIKFRALVLLHEVGLQMAGYLQGC